MFYLTETEFVSIMTEQIEWKAVESTVCTGKASSYPGIAPFVHPEPVFCRNGRRGKGAAQEPFDMSYTNIFKFGGNIDWTCEIATDNEMEE